MYPDSQASAARRTETSLPMGRAALLACWVLLALIWFVPLGWRALFSPDEGRYASIGLAMLQSGDWITPRLNGLLYFEKPILQYWITAASLAVFGINEFAARFWPALSGFLTVVVVGMTARRLWGAGSGAYAALLAAGMTWIGANSHFLTLDMGLAFFQALSLCAFLVAQHDDATPSERRNAMWVCWAAMAGATLSKGLVGIVIPGATLVLYSLLNRQWAFWRRMHWVSGLVIYFALTAPWFIAVSLKNPGFFDFFFVREHFRRFLTDEARRTGAPWYFVPVLIVGAMPWTTMLPAWLWRGSPRDASASFQPARMLVVWSVFIFVFFSVSRSKLPSYILPMFPALALLGAYWLPKADPRRLRWHLLAPVAFWVVALGVWPRADLFVSDTQPLSAVQSFLNLLAIAAVVSLLACGAAWWLLGRGRKMLAVALVSVASVLGVASAMLGHDSYAYKMRSSKSVGLILAPYLRPDTPVFAVSFYDQSLPFYLRRPVTLVDYRDEFTFGQDAEPERWIPSVDGFVDRWKAAPRAAAMMPPEVYAQMLAIHLPMRVVYEDVRRLVVIKPEDDAP
ncbi:phospholipid carrier-dependent glycosyltransferase [Ottowia sp. VDI28]|uniref:phospholipid carrier-dependent glycosyltransferase n=1 Tax=Ottowia sp. VDI28 TaxID=3133968 RepID=UPI003C2E3258